MWFDRGELRSVELVSDDTMQALEGIETDPAIHVNLDERRRCPRCVDSVLMRHCSSPTRAVTIDECPTCAGIWLDNGELARIRAEHVTGVDRRRAALKLFEAGAIDERMTLIGKQLESDLPDESWSRRIVSGFLVALYVFAQLTPAQAAPLFQLQLAFRIVTGSFATGPRPILVFCAVPIACIWYPGMMAQRKSPRIFVRLVGWGLLLLPLLIASILLAEGVRDSPFS